MRDAVAEVLLERRALAPRRSPWLILSVGLHVLVAIVIITGTRRGSTLPSRSSVLSIRLAPQPVPPPPVVKPAVRPAPAPPPPESEKPKVEKAEKKTPKKPVEKALFGKSTERPVPSPKSRVPSPQLTPAIPAPGTAGVASLEGGDFPFPFYIDRMLKLIGSHWLRPQTQSEVTAQIYFVIEKDGRLRDVNVEKQSGSNVFDRAALRAVIEAAPLPPLPFAYSGTYLGVHLTFH